VVKSRPHFKSVLNSNKCELHRTSILEIQDMLCLSLAWFTDLLHYNSDRTQHCQLYITRETAVPNLNMARILLLLSETEKAIQDRQVTNRLQCTTTECPETTCLYQQ